MEPIVVYVVVEEDRGLGPTVLKVFRNRDDAEKFGADGWRCWIEEAELV